MTRAWIGVGMAAAAVAAGVFWAQQPEAAEASRVNAAPSSSAGINPVPGMPPVRDPLNVYSETVAGRFSPAVEGALERVYVPNRAVSTVSVIDPSTLKVVSTFRVGLFPQHVVPSYDLRTLWVANNAEGTKRGSLTPIDPKTGKPGKDVPVEDPYNMYWSPDGRHAIVVAEAFERLDFRDAQSMALDYSIPVPGCKGINHADFSIDGRYALFTCEFVGTVVKVDLVERKVLGSLKLNAYVNRPEVQALLDVPGKKAKRLPDPIDPTADICTTPGMPQDIRISPDGRKFYIADMMVDGVHIVDFASFKQLGFVRTGKGAHGLYPSRDGKQLYVANRGSNRIRDKKGGPGSVSVLDFASEKVVAHWSIPGGGSPDMGNVSADGKYLWLSGRYDNVVYRFDTANGRVEKIAVGIEPHGLTVWPQPGRYSLGHTGNLR